MWRNLIRALVVLLLLLGFIGFLFLQSFLAFGIFFVSLYILIFLHMKDTAAKMSLSTLDLLINRQRLPKRSKLILIAFGILGISVLLSFLIPLGVKKYPFIVYFGMCSFAITMFLIMMLSLISCLFAQWRYARHNFKVWKQSMSPSSPAIRYQAVRTLASSKDPVLNKYVRIFNKVGFFCLFLWFVVLLIVICTVLYLDYIGAWDDLVNKYG